MTSPPAITIYVPCNAYGRYLPEALDSVFRQSRTDWELIVFDDGSTDETAAVAERYRTLAPDRVRVVRNDRSRGLHYNANRAIEMARGKYVMRLDADDWLDDAALLVLAGQLDARDEVGLVYPNYFYVDAEGRYLGTEFRKRAGSEDALLDLPAHGACTMVRRRVLKAIGGYDESHSAQDGYELWLKVVHRYGVASVSTPLFFYRQHEASLSRDDDRILNARGRIKARLAERASAGPLQPRVLAVVPVKNTYRHLSDLAFRSIGGKPLLDWTLDAAVGAGCAQVVVTTDDERVVRHALQRGLLAFRRDASLSEPDRRLSEVVLNAVEHVEREHDVHADAVLTLSAHAPLRDSADITRAVQTLTLFDADTVISVYEDYDLHFLHGQHGLAPMNPGMIKRLRLEREALYVFNGAISVSWRESMTRDALFGRRVSHVTMPRDTSLQIKSEHDIWLAEQLLLRGRDAKE
jgi:glycosyltransferase involved in cell wall biosynthesis/CMP-N-acetylneuraminic acid synthetase